MVSRTAEVENREAVYGGRHSPFGRDIYNPTYKGVGYVGHEWEERLIAQFAVDVLKICQDQPCQTNYVHSHQLYMVNSTVPNPNGF